MKKYISIIMILLTTSLFSIEVDIDEISKSKRVDFVNYTGQTSKSESVNEIKSIGHRLSYLMKNGKSGVLYRYNMKYSIFRAIDKDNDKLSADILFIDKTAQVDHIKNVRRIISSYMEGMYAYTAKEADAVAVYVTYYNAVYRGDTDFFSARYVPAVMKHLTKNNAGIATHYKEWPGNTAIVIPLTEQNMRGEIANIDTFAISDARVRKEVAKDKDNKEATETIDTVKKKELDQSKKDVEADKKTIQDRKEKIETEKTKIAAKEQTIEKKKEEIKKEKEAAAKITNPEQRKAKEEEIKKKEEEVKREERRLAEEQKKINAAESQVKKAEESADKREQNISKKEEDLKDDKSSDKTIARNEDQIKKEAELNQRKEAELNQRENALKNQNKGDGIFGLKIYYLEVKDYFEGGHYNNILYQINTQTNKIEMRSPFTDVCGRRYEVFSGGIVVISHNGNHKAGHKLTLINKDTLREITTGEENIFWRSFVEIKNNHIYAIVKDPTKDDFYLGKFDINLKLVARSKEKIFMNTFITFFNDNIYINSEDKAVLVLKESDLSLVSVIRP